MENAKEVFDFVFHWAGVWAVMVYGTVGAVRGAALSAALRMTAKRNAFSMRP